MPDKNKHNLFLGDCRQLLAKIPNHSIDLIFADPPYFLSNDGMGCSGGKVVSVNKGEWDRGLGFEKEIAFAEEWLAECRRVLKPTGTIWVSGTYHSIFKVGFAMQKLGFHILNDVAWFKPNTSPNLSCRMLTASHETLLWARPSKESKHYFDYEKSVGWNFGKDILKKPGKQMRSVWNIPITPPSEKILGRHPTQKPLELLRRLDQAW